MNIYLISQDVNNEYDTFDSAVVVASTEEEARKTHPSSCSDSVEVWAEPKDVHVMLIGKANVYASEELEVVCSSFNAG